MSNKFSLLTPDAQSLYQQGQAAGLNLPNISSGFRTPGENAAAGGARQSDHLTGNAFDIPTRGMTREQSQQVIDYYRNNYSSSDVFVNDERNRPGHGPHIHVSWRGKEGGAADAAKDGQKAGGDSKSKDGQGGDKNKDQAQQKDREDPTDKNKEIGQKTKPPEPTKHDDIQGEPGKYKQVQTSSIVGRLPTHEPWPYHPKSQLGPRQGVSRADPGNSEGNDSGGGGGGGSSGSGASSNPSGSTPNNSSIQGNQNPANLDKSTDPQKAAAIAKAAKALGVDPTNLAAIISYESAGSMSPSIRGGRNKDGSGAGSFVGLIQFSPDNQRKYGVSGSQSFEDQLMNSVVPYMRDRGVKPGASLLQMYSSVNAGRAGDGNPNNPLYQRSDVNGNQLRHVQNIANGGHMKRAQRIMGSLSGGPPRGDNGMNPANANSAPSAPSSNSTSGSQQPSSGSQSGTDSSNSDSGTTTPNATDKAPGTTQGSGAQATNQGNQGGNGSTSPGKPNIKVSLVGQQVDAGSGVAKMP